ncbi:MAG: spore coat protein [Gorillibacterium sp.]|nr:spore coat protein [Gorillibacterium sp.]
MSIKKKLTMSVATAALGLSLVGGGTWAAFNDTATINNTFASGTLDLQVGSSGSKPINFDLSNMKPGDNVQRIFTLRNIGSLAIKEVLLNTTASNFVDRTLLSTEAEFLSQFEIDFMQVDSESTQWEPRAKITMVGQTLTLADLVDGTYAAKVKPEYLSSGKINLAPLTVAPGASVERGLPVTPADTDDVFIQITFKNDPSKNLVTNESVQNKFQGDSVNFAFNLEATQWAGVHVDSHNGNGAVNNGVQGSADDTTNPVTQPSQRTTGTPTITNVVVD